MEPPQQINLEIHGRHAMLFDDDANAAFVNSKEALIEWNSSLFIDRYDVRFLLPNPPPSSFRKLPHAYHSLSHAYVDVDESLLDIERYADLPPPSPPPQPQQPQLEVETHEEVKNASGYRAVAFSYGDTTDATNQKDSDAAGEVDSFHPPFPVPESILQNLPPTEKLHQIISRTAIFVSEHGGQSEIVLRVKQGDNPTFGFLMPHHHLHPYFRYLVEHPELLKVDNNSKSQKEKAGESQAGGALSLLGSVYGSGEDEDAATDADREFMPTGETSAASEKSNSKPLDHTSTFGNMTRKDEKILELQDPSKGKPSMSSKNVISRSKSSFPSDTRKGDELANSVILNGSSLFPVSKAGTTFVDPPSEVKRLVDRIVEIVLKNGRDFEAVLIEQDKKLGKFPFLLPSNQYHSYYLRVLRKAHESRSGVKASSTEKDGPPREEMEKTTASLNDFELQLDYDRKEKFKMVIGKSKREQDQPSTQQHGGFSVDASAAAAILQAATRGISRSNSDVFSKTSLNGTTHGSSKEYEQPLSSEEKYSDKGKPSVTFPVAKEVAKTAALAASSEAESSEAGLTREQQVKAERLRRAKMFAAMIRSGSLPLVGKETSRAVSVEPQGCGVSGLATGASGNLKSEGREDGFDPAEARTSEKSEKGEIDSDYENEHKSRKMRHYRSRKCGSEEEEEKREKDDEDKEEDQRKSRKKHKSHRSRHHRDRSKDRHKHKRRRSSKSKESRHRHSHDNYSEESEDDDSGHHRHKQGSSSEDEQKQYKQRHKYDSSEDEGKHRKRKHKRSRREEDRHERRTREDRHERRTREDMRKSHKDQVDLEEGEIRTKSSDKSETVVDVASREASVDVSKSPNQDKRTPSLPPRETTEVSDDLRAKVRAMLLATM